MPSWPSPSGSAHGLKVWNHRGLIGHSGNDTPLFPYKWNKTKVSHLLVMSIQSIHDWSSIKHTDYSSPVLRECHQQANMAARRPDCNGGYFSETSLHPRIPPARPRDPVIHIKPQAPKARGCCLIRIQVRNKEQSLSPEPRLNGECWDTVTLAQFGVKLERVNDMIMCFGVLHIYLLQSSILMHLLTTFDFRETDLEIDYVRRHIAWRLRFRFLSVY